MRDMVERQIRGFIIENFLFGESENGLKDGDSLLEQGVIDSTGVLELVSFVEQTFDIKVEDEELIPENLDSIIYIVDFIMRKQDALNELNQQAHSPQLAAASASELHK